MVQPQETHQPPLRTVMESYVNVTGATYTAKAGDRLIGVNRDGAVTITLPAAQLRAGRTYTVSTLYDLAVNDYVEVRIYQDSGGALNTAKNEDMTPQFMMIKVA